MLFIVFASSVAATVLQHSCIRLGVITGQDLGECCRAKLPYYVNLALYVLAEMALILTDMTDVIGFAISLKIIFGIPKLWGTALGLIQPLIVLFLMDHGDSKEISRLDSMIFLVMSTVALCLLADLFLTDPLWPSIFKCMLPVRSVYLIITNKKALFCCLGILGATVMPHNLYLHSSIVKGTSRISADIEDLGLKITEETINSIFAMGLASLINGAVLICSACLPLKTGSDESRSIEDTLNLINEHFGTLAFTLFGVALLASSFGSSVSGVLAGQIVIEGHLQVNPRSSFRRIVTRSITIIPTLCVILLLGEATLGIVLVLSQVLLTLLLPFSMIPLIIFSSNASLEAENMSDEHINEPLIIYILKWASWVIGGIIVSLNFALLVTGIFNE